MMPSSIRMSATDPPSMMKRLLEASVALTALRTHVSMTATIFLGTFYVRYIYLFTQGGLYDPVTRDSFKAGRSWSCRPSRHGTGRLRRPSQMGRKGVRSL